MLCAQTQKLGNDRKEQGSQRTELVDKNKVASLTKHLIWKLVGNVFVILGARIPEEGIGRKNSAEKCKIFVGIWMI
ncbi:hypothetical protein Y032_0132g1687 [Ancylostoma ceylanicum]|uniref:Uncharacterized protein n=1 Tax=Ancylostoma ceylanicum TaxID=53326 RepID=A0A016T5L9_9BILA|nr:hypothetical protein Y032_0132g1687 [Ancylostoma ceylanicum]